MPQIIERKNYMAGLTPSKAVSAGASALDAKRPGWEREMDTSTLDLASSCHCVLGQLFGCFVSGVNHLSAVGVSGPWAIQHGFDIQANIDNRPYAYAELEDAWVDLIKERFSSGALSS